MYDILSIGKANVFVMPCFSSCCLVVSIGVLGAFCSYGHHCNDVCAMKCMLLVVFIVCKGLGFKISSSTCCMI
jgi:hypothetical protein